MKIYYGGAEQNTWRQFLHDNGVDTVSLSWFGLRRRRQDLRSYRIADEFPEGMKIFVDSGAYSVNKQEITQDEAYDMAQDYMDFVEANIASIEFASEFDALALGRPLLTDIRHNFWENLPGDKWMAVWHSEWGSGNLRELAGRYERVGILQSDGSNQDVSSLLRTLAGGTRFHGIAMTKMELMRDLPLDSVGSTSWLSPTQYGDTFVWDGQELHRYPKKYKHRRTEHRSMLRDNGFDTDLIEADNNHELLRLSLWSWQHFADSIRGRGVTTDVLQPFPANEEVPHAVVDTQVPPSRNRELIPRREHVLLPILQTQTHTISQADGTEVSQQVLRAPTGNFIQCDTCYIKDRCPMFSPGSECAYEIPVEIRTSPQLTALQDTLIEIQTQRVMRMNLIEQVEGGHADKNTSEEMDRLQRMIDKKINNAKERTPLIQMAVQGGSGGPGFISRMWGEATATRVNELPAPVNPMDVLDAELVDD
jgi:hypothetical protein